MVKRPFTVSTIASVPAATGGSFTAEGEATDAASARVRRTATRRLLIGLPPGARPIVAGATDPGGTSANGLGPPRIR
jgi:hypothetical protein